MTTPSRAARREDPVRRFLRTPKGLLLLTLAALVAIAAPGEGLGVVGAGLAASVLLAAMMDVVILKARTGLWQFPSGAILTALIVAMVLSPHEPWPVTAATVALAIASKYLIRGRTANVFNPAALAIVATFYLFDTGQSWWGALPDAVPAAMALLMVTGAFITHRVNKMPMVLTFLGVYYLLFTVTAFIGDPRVVAEVFRTPDLQAALFFAFFILTDPPTSPTEYRHQVWCGAIVAVVSVAVFLGIGAVYYLLAGVLAGNVWEAWRRWRPANRLADRLARSNAASRG